MAKAIPTDGYGHIVDAARCKVINIPNLFWQRQLPAPARFCRSCRLNDGRAVPRAVGHIGGFSVCRHVDRMMMMMPGRARRFAARAISGYGCRACQILGNAL